VVEVDVSVASLARTMAIVGEVAEHGPLTVDAISAGTELPLSTTYRYVADLVKLGYLAPVKHSRYTLGPGLAGLVRQANRRCRHERLATAQAAVRRAAPHASAPQVLMLATRVVDALDPAEVPS
jgi:DNA-binding IclR family transcriptional regulator